MSEKHIKQFSGEKVTSDNNKIYLNLENSSNKSRYLYDGHYCKRIIFRTKKYDLNLIDNRKKDCEMRLTYRKR